MLKKNLKPQSKPNLFKIYLSERIPSKISKFIFCFKAIHYTVAV